MTQRVSVSSHSDDKVHVTQACGHNFCLTPRLNRALFCVCNATSSTVISFSCHLIRSRGKGSSFSQFQSLLSLTVVRQVTQENRRLSVLETSQFCSAQTKLTIYEISETFYL